MRLVLRHEPTKYGLVLDVNGWTAVDELLAAAQRAGVPLTRPLMEQVIADNEKQRFALSDDGSQVRARQGHSVEVDLGLAPVTPLETLCHGTAATSVDAIRRAGSQRRSRQHVHLSPDEETAIKVGQRHGKPVVLRVQAAALHRAGHQFFLSENGVWLVDAVPPEFLA